MFFIYIYLKQDEMAIEDKKNLGWIVILIMMFSILKNLFVVLYFGFLNMRKKMKAMFSAEDEQIDSPHTSDDDSDTIDSVDTEEIEDDLRREEYEREEYNERIKQKQLERESRTGGPRRWQQPDGPGGKGRSFNNNAASGHYAELELYGNSAMGGTGLNQSGFGFSMTGSPVRQQTPVYLPGQMELDDMDVY